jgi:hypothetical protein
VPDAKFRIAGIGKDKASIHTPQYKAHVAGNPQAPSPPICVYLFQRVPNWPSAPDPRISTIQKALPPLASASAPDDLVWQIRDFGPSTHLALDRHLLHTLGSGSFAYQARGDLAAASGSSQRMKG